MTDEFYNTAKMKERMLFVDYQELLKQLEHAPLYEVYRLREAMGLMLDDPVRVGVARDRLVPGQTVNYFNWQENRLVQVKILELKRTRVLVQEHETGSRYTIPVYWVSIEDAEVPLPTQRSGTGIDRSELSVGDQVGFRDRNNVLRHGEVIRLNPRTVTLIVDGHAQWRVAYGLLFDIIDSQRPARKLVESITLFDE